MSHSGPSSWVCLALHDVVPTTGASGGGAEHYATPLPAFQRVLDVIKELGYAGCSLAASLRERSRPRIAITFDDARHGVGAFAVPALRARGMTATVFTPTALVGQHGFMSWDELRSAAAAGMSIQSHTRTHPFLSECNAAEVRSELADSKAALDRELKQDTTEIALPGGDAPPRSLRYLLAETGYRVVAGSRWGLNVDRPETPGGTITIRRCVVRGDISTEMARRIVSGDPWLAMKRYPRDVVLARIRSTLGPTRYARWRRQLLDTVSASAGS